MKTMTQEIIQRNILALTDITFYGAWLEENGREQTELANKAAGVFLMQIEEGDQIMATLAESNAAAHRAAAALYFRAAQVRDETQDALQVRQWLEAARKALAACDWTAQAFIETAQAKGQGNAALSS